MPVAHYNNNYQTTGVPHPAYRSYETDMGIGPPAGSLSGGVPISSSRPAGPSHPNQNLVHPPNVPVFTLPPNGVAYTGHTGHFPHNGAPSASYHGGLGQVSTSTQSATSTSNSHAAAAGATMGNNPQGSCPVGYSPGMGYPAHPAPHQQQLPSQMIHSHDHYDHFMSPRGHNNYPRPQQPTYGIPPEESSGYHQHHLNPHAHPHEQQQQGMHMSSSLSTLYEDCEDISNYSSAPGTRGGAGGYLQHPLPSELPPQHPPGPTRLHPAEAQDPRGTPQDPRGTPQVLPAKIEPEWWHDGDVLDRLQHIHLHADRSPSRERTTPRRKRRNSEKRKEKSRDAARCRRGKESEIFNELATTVPLPAKIVGQLDKASVMRLSIANLKTRSLCDAVLTQKPEDNVVSDKMDVEMDSLYLEAMGGFIMALSADADIDYTSENIVTFLGLPQEDVMGMCLHDYIHPCDHDDVRELLSGKGQQEYRHAFLRFKCTITAKGRSVNLKSASYKVVHVRGKMVRNEEDDQAWLLALCTPVPHPSNIEFPLDKQTFVSKHSLDMKFTYVDDNVNEFCGYAADELMGRSLFEMHHALDNDIIKDAYKTLRSKGQVETDRYRFLARDGGYLWVVTQATLINGPKDHKPQCVVCLNYVVSGVESRGEVLSELQLRCSNSSNSKSCAKALESAPVPVAPVVSSIATPTVPQPKADIQPKVTQVVDVSPAPPPARVAPAHPPPPTPVATTFKIFTPRTEEMNKGYLIFSESDPLGIVLKDEPDDLTHLAPSGGDTCVPLEVPTFIPELDDMFGLDYKQLPISSTDALFTSHTALSDKSLEQGNGVKYEEYEVTDRGKIYNRSSVSKVSIDESGSSSPSSNCSSPAGGLRTPEPPKPLFSQASLYQSLPESKPYKGVVESSRPRTTTKSLFTQLDGAAGVGSNSDGYSKLELKLEGQNMDVDEFDLRAPYIPRSNEVLMLLPDDLICQDDLMWGAHPESIISPNSLPISKRNLKCPSLMQEEEDSSLAQLLRDRDPPIAGPGQNINSGNPATGPHRNQYQQSKFLDGGGSFVDPNKVLPGHFGGKDGLDDGAGGGILEDGPPQVMMHEQVEPPPPLVRDSPHQSSLTAKRRYSPSSSPLLAHKKMCSSPYDHQQRSLHQSRDGSQHLHQVPQMQTQPTGIRELTTPYAPTMQQLLISKEPITVRGGRPGGAGGGGGGISAPLLSMHKGKDSVLRNLLNLSGDCEDSQNGGDHKISTTPIRITQDRMTAMLLAGGGSINSTGQLSYPKLRIVTGGQGSHLLAENHSLKMTSGCGSGSSVGAGGSVTVSGESYIKRSKRQDPFLLMDPDLTIPNLFDLSQLDYEVNAPANSSLLQGADLLMALDQSL